MTTTPTTNERPGRRLERLRQNRLFLADFAAGSRAAFRRDAAVADPVPNPQALPYGG